MRASNFFCPKKKISKIVIFLIFAILSIFVNLNLFSQDYSSKKDLNAVELYNAGLDFFSEKAWWNASEKFQEAIQKNPAYFDAWYMLAKCSYQMNQFDLAVQYVENAKKYGGDKIEYKKLKAFCFISLNKFKEAENLFKSVLNQFPNDVESRFGLAELDLFNGRLTGAQVLYKDALKREPVNVKALLSLALVSTELGNHDVAKTYINKALQAYSDNPEVYFIAAYLSVINGDYKDAERKCLMAVQENPQYDLAYELLGTIYYAQERYQDVIDIADFRINRNRNLTQAWYIKGLAQEKLGQYEQSILTWQSALRIDPTDEIMRSAFELSILKNTDIEDSRRKTWALYRVQKGQEFQKKYLGQQVRYEYQIALKIDPNNKTARNEFSKILYNDGFNENYLEQIKFIKENSILQNSIEEKKNINKKLSDAEVAKEIQYVKLSDTIEGFESLMQNTLAKKWNINPFYLDKTRWNIGIFYMEKVEPLYHSDLARVAANSLRLLFQGISVANVNLVPKQVSSYADAYKNAYDNKLDYFIILVGDETERDVKLDATMYSARNGSKTQTFSVYRTGNDRFSGALLRLRQNILSVLPVKAKILNRSQNEILVDIGKSEGIVKDAVFKVVKKNSIKTSDTGVGLVYADSDVLGTVVLSRVSEEISEGILSDTGFYDRVNSGDELVLIKNPEKEKTQSQVALDTSPQKAEQKEEVKNPLKGADLEINRTPSLLKMIKELQ